MSKRNFILLMIVSVFATVAIIGFLYLRQTQPRGDEGEGTNFISRFNPFGSTKTPPPPATPPIDIDGATPPSPEEELSVKLKKISSLPVAGFGIFIKERLKEIPIITPSETTSVQTTVKPTIKKPTPPPTEFMPAVRYVSRADGIIYQTFLDKLEERKFSETIIPKVYEASFGNKANSVIMRYLKFDDRTIATFFGNLPKEILGGDTTVKNEIKGSFLPDNITDLSMSPDGTKIFYLFEMGNNVIGTTFNLLDGKKTQVFDSSFTEWLSSWPKSSMITLTTKPSYNTPGYIYKIDPSTKVFTRVFGDINGLTTLTSPDGKLVLYSGNTLLLSTYDVSTKNSLSLGVRTLPEKCVWGRASDVVYCAVPRFIDGAGYPDLWYQGEVSFSDQIWKINILNGNTTIISDPIEELGGEDIDGIKLALDESGKYLLFVNKKDSFLWELELN